MVATPKDAAIDVLDRVDALLTMDAVGTHPGVRRDLRRQAIAMSVAAIDTYLHWAVKRTDLDSMGKPLADLKVSFAQLVAMGDQSVRARQTGRDDRPRARARAVLNDQLQRLTFQSADQVKTALEMVGLSDVWTQLAAAMPGATKTEIIASLNRLANRRNRIVHEGDLLRKARPQTVQRRRIDRSEVDEDVAWVRRFVDALAVVCP